MLLERLSSLLLKRRAPYVKREARRSLSRTLAIELDLTLQVLVFLARDKADTLQRGQVFLPFAYWEAAATTLPGEAPEAVAKIPGYTVPAVTVAAVTADLWVAAGGARRRRAAPGANPAVASTAFAS